MKWLYEEQIGYKDHLYIIGADMRAGIVKAYADDDFLYTSLYERISEYFQ